MRAEDIMVGDWVRNDFGEIQQVVELRQEGAMLSYNDIYRYDDIQPIPLTPDMLLDNGFELQELGGERISVWTGFGEDSCDEDIEVEFEGIKPIWLKIDGPFYLTTPNIEYLHQLQHFLRDCETGKEIVL